MANLITLTRFLFLFVLVALAVYAPPVWQLGNMPLLALIIALDGLDGYVARRRGEVSAFGSVFDIVVDRIIEYVLWIVLTSLELVPLWVTILFITRGVIVDSIRFTAVSKGATVFGMMWSRVGRWLVAGRFMRGLYGTVKAVTFGWLFLLQPLPALVPGLWIEWSAAAGVVSHTLIIVAVALCLARGIPVIVEYLVAEGILGKPKSVREMP